MVSIEAWAKSRSGSLLINGKLRKTMCFQVFGRKQNANYHLTSKGNPRDDPTRDVPLRKPARAEPWLKPLLVPESMLCMSFHNRPTCRKWGRELYAGSAGLMHSCRLRGVRMLAPIEAYGPEGYRKRFDLDDIVCQKLLERDISSGLVWYLHWGIQCKAWGQLSTFNGGTRTKERPDGSPIPLERGRCANQQAMFMCRMCVLLHTLGGVFTIENPFYRAILTARYERLLTCKGGIKLKVSLKTEIDYLASTCQCNSQTKRFAF